MSGIIKPSEIVKELDKYVIGQEAAKKALALAYVNNLTSSLINTNLNIESKLNKRNLTFIGNTGCGKSYLVTTLTRLMGLKLVEVNCAELTQSGYVGSDLKDVRKDIFSALEEENGRQYKVIVFCDEIDKISKSATGDRDVVGSSGVQRELLKMIDGFDGSTSDIMWIFAGAFSDYTESKRITNKSIGFDSVIEKVLVDVKYDQEFLIGSGLYPELVGRMGQVVPLKSLNDDDMLKILLESFDSPLKQAEILGKARDIDVSSIINNDEVLRELVADAVKLNLGSRGLNTMVQERIDQLMYI